MSMRQGDFDMESQELRVRSSQGQDYRSRLQWSGIDREDIVRALEAT